ncbi:MAG: membrane dipeptidase, partial [Opitutaceae bacterium]|nr:membrane dipeptidase [Opitutaceae bacterium]
YNKPVIIDGSYWYMIKHIPPHKESPARQQLARTITGYTKTLAEVLRAYPTLAFSLAHAGTASQMSDYDEIYRLMAEHPNVYCDTAAVTGYVGEYNGYNATWMEDLVRAIGAGKVMYGTDWPYWAVGVDSFLKDTRRWTIIADECPNLTEAEKRVILAENAERFVKNLLPVPAVNLSPYAERARALHRDNVVIVTHDHNPIDTDAPRMLAGGVTGKCFQIGVDVEIGADCIATGAKRAGWAEKTMQALDEAERTIKADPKRLLLATTAEDFLRAKREGKIAILLGVEGAKLLEGKLEWLDKFHARGLRELQLTWAVPNQVVERSGKTGDGLTDFGKAVIRRCNELGIIVCLTHMPFQAFHEAIALATKPPILSHDAFALGKLSGVGAAELKALASRRGLIGIHFYSTYLGPAPCPERVVDQIDRIAAVAGIDTVALGCDFFPTSGPWAELQHAQGAQDQDIVWAVRGISQISQVTEALLARRYSEPDIIRILSGNYLRVCQEVFGK